MSTFSITINHWAAWMPGVVTYSEWQQWAVAEKQPHVDYELPSIPEIKPMLRRRLSSLGKIALSTACSVINKEQDRCLPNIFCSRHGDLQRTVSLLKELAYQNPLSPTYFSLSVHNAIAGIMSISRKDKSSITALSCNQHEIAHVFLEARGIMEEQCCDEVLCVIYDEPIPAFYNQPNDSAPYSVAFLVSRAPLPEDSRNDNCAATPTTLDFSIDKANKNNDINNEPQALQLLRFLFSDRSSDLSFNGSRCIWQCSSQKK